jgi:hypothetical protein
MHTTLHWYVSIAARYSTAVLLNQILHVGSSRKIDAGPLDSNARRSWLWLS